MVMASTGKRREDASLDRLFRGMAHDGVTRRMDYLCPWKGPWSLVNSDAKIPFFDEILAIMTVEEKIQCKVGYRFLEEAGGDGTGKSRLLCTSDLASVSNCFHVSPLKWQKLPNISI